MIDVLFYNDTILDSLEIAPHIPSIGNPGVSFPLFNLYILGNQTFSYDFIMQMREAFVQQTLRFGYVMLAIGIIFGFIFGIEVMQFINREKEPISDDEDLHGAPLSERIRER